MNENGNTLDTVVRMIDDTCAIGSLEDRHLLVPKMNPNSRLHVDFNDLSYSICNGREKTKTILKGVSGCFRPERLTVIIGPSGAGKSTLLHTISTLRTNNVRGTITINGTPWTSDEFRKRACFVPQEFALLPLLTARETLYIAVRLKLRCGSDQSHVIRTAVEETAENLGLKSCLETRVENLSGGERKRLSIGIEMITKPSVLLLDEPTSGLDSSSSNQMISLLHKVAKSGCTVVCAVHQPSSRMISQFDDILVLHHGKCFYCGPWNEILNTFNSADYSCPQFYNIAEFVLEVVTGERGGDLEHLYKISHDSYLKRRARYQGQQIEMNSISTEKIDEEQNYMKKSKSSSTWEQQKVLFLRAIICIKRDNTMTKLRFAAHIVVALLLGIVFYNCGNNATRITSNIACIFFILLFLFFSSSMPAVQIFPTEAAVFLREYMNNWYNLRSYYVVKIVSDLPMQILSPTVFTLITYYMTGQPMEYHRFFRTWINCVLTTIVGQSSGILTGLAFNTQIGVFLIPALSMPMILFAGFFLKFNEMPVYLQPLCMISFFRYSFEGILQAIYDGDRERLPCPEIYCYIRRPKRILEEMDMPAVSYHTTVLILCIWIISLQILIYFVLKWKSYVGTR